MIVVVFDVVLRCLVGVMGGMHDVPVRRMGVMRGLFVVTGLVVPGGLAMMMRSTVVMIRGALVMILVRLGVHWFLLSRMTTVRTHDRLV
ncbi:MAG TPA: hypothetical protein VK281_18680 [Xanthobacteraceae bacterium]|nr:hypothetical protein [Xanthobacteraceae bacterium]